MSAQPSESQLASCAKTLDSAMARTSARQTQLNNHVARLLQCRRCPRVVPPPVSGGAILSEVLLVGQAPGVREPVLKRPFAHTAGKTLFRWFHEFCGMDEARMRTAIYFAAVNRCFPGKSPGGGDRVPDPTEIRNCSSWLNDEIELLRPRLVIPIGKLAISQFIVFQKLDQVIGRKFSLDHNGQRFDLIPLPHPSGASTWHRMSTGKLLLARAMRLISKHPAILALPGRTSLP